MAEIDLGDNNLYADLNAATAILHHGKHGAIHGTGSLSDDPSSVIKKPLDPTQVTLI